MKFSLILFGLAQLLKHTARRHPAFRARLAERNLVAQIKTADDSQGRHFTFRDGRISSRRGIHPRPDIALVFKNARLGARLLTPPIDYQEQIDAQKGFNLTVEGPDDLNYWFAQTIMQTRTVGWSYGTDGGDGTTRYTSMTNGGPIFVYVKDGKILRITPIVFDDDDARPWSIEARGKTFTPPRRTSLASHGMNWKSMVYSPDRLLHPMKRVDFDPDGERNTQNRG